MANVTVTIELTLSPGMDGGWFAFGTDDVDLVNNRGRATLDDTSAPRYHCWYAGPSGGTCTYEVKLGDKSLVKKTRSIPEGWRTGRSVGTLRFS